MCAEGSWIGDGCSKEKGGFGAAKGTVLVGDGNAKCEEARVSFFPPFFFRLASSSFSYFAALAPSPPKNPVPRPSKTKDFFFFLFVFVFAFCQLTRSSCLTLVHPSSPIPIHSPSSAVPSAGVPSELHVGKLLTALILPLPLPFFAFTTFAASLPTSPTTLPLFAH